MNDLQDEVARRINDLFARKFQMYGNTHKTRIVVPDTKTLENKQTSHTDDRLTIEEKRTKAWNRDRRAEFHNGIPETIKMNEKYEAARLERLRQQRLTWSPAKGVAVNHTLTPPRYDKDKGCVVPIPQPSSMWYFA